MKNNYNNHWRVACESTVLKTNSIITRQIIEQIFFIHFFSILNNECLLSNFN